MIATEMWYELIKDYNHWIFEGAHDVIQFAILALIARMWVKLHDRKNHGHNHCEDVHETVGQSEFWTDLQDNLKDPEFLKAYIEESIRVAIIDQQMNGNKELLMSDPDTWTDI